MIKVLLKLKFISFTSYLIFVLSCTNIYAQNHDHVHDAELLWHQYNDEQVKDSAFKALNIKLSDADEHLFYAYLEKELGSSGVRFHQYFSEKDPSIDELIKYRAKEFNIYKDTYRSFVRNKSAFEKAISLNSLLQRTNVANGPCMNTNFESGDFTGWVGAIGRSPFDTICKADGSGNFNPICCLTAPCSVTTGFSLKQHRIMTKNDVDSRVPVLPTVYPVTGRYSIRLGDTINGGNVAILRQTFQVTSSNNIFIYHYAVVLEEPSSDHTDKQRPYFSAKMYDQNGAEIQCAKFSALAKFPLQNFVKYGTTNFFYRNWSTVSIDLNAYIGQNVTIEFIASDCSPTGHLGYAYIDANCYGLENNYNYSICKDNLVTLKSVEGFDNYKWTGPGIVGLDTLPYVKVNKTGIYKLTTISQGENPCTQSVTYTVNPTNDCIMSYDTSACERIKNSKQFNTNLNGYNSKVTSYLINPATVLSWHTALPNANNIISNATNYTVSDGQTLYALISVNVSRTDTIKLYFTVRTRPNASFTSLPTCFGSVPFNLVATPGGGNFYGTNVNSKGVFTGKLNSDNVVKYIAIDENGCTDTVTTDISLIEKTPLNFDYCAGNTPTQLTLNDGNAYTWYKDAAATTPLNADFPLSSGISVNYTAPTGTQGDQIVYYTNLLYQSGGVGPNNVTTTDWSGAAVSKGSVLTLKVLTPTTLNTFQVNPGWKINSNTNYTFTLNGQTFSQILKPNVLTTINVNLLLQPGTYTLTSSGALNYNPLTNSSLANVINLSNPDNLSAYANLTFTAPNNNPLGCFAHKAILHEIVCCVKPTITNQPQNICVIVDGTSKANFSVTATSTNTLTYQWQSDNGTNSFTNISGATNSTYSTNIVTLAMLGYKYRCIVNSNGCVDTTQVAILNITTSPTVSTPASVCQNSTSPNLSSYATASSGATLNWYTTATGGTSSSTAPSISTSTSGIKNIWVSQTINACESNRVQISFTVNALPTVTGTATPSTICSGNSTTLKGTGASTYTWENGASDNVAINPTSTTTYIVTGTDANGCINTSTVTVTVNAIPASPNVTNPTAICQYNTIPNLTSNATGTNLLWYAASSGGTGSTTIPTLSAAIAGNFDVFVSQTINSCESGRSKITLTVNAGPNAPTVTQPNAVCLNDVVPTLSVTGNNLIWYSQASGGTGSTVAPTLSATTAGVFDYYVSQTDLGCEGPRAKISFKVNTLPTVTGTATPATICSGNSTTLKGTGANTYTWDNGASDNVAINPTSTTTYTVTGTDANGCINTSTITVTVNAIPASPNVTNPTAICQYNTIPNLTSNAIGTNLLWYAASSGGTGSATIPTLSAAIAGNFDVFVSQTINSCESGRSKITLTVNAGPNAPTVTQPNAVCLNDVVPTLSVTGNNLIWYSQASGGTGSTVAPTLSATTAGVFDYYVSQTDLGCEGPRAKISFKVNALPTVTGTATPATICSGNSTTLKGAGASTYTWDNGASDNLAINPTGTTTYTVTGTDANGCINTSTVVVTVNQIPNIPVITNPLDICVNAISPNLNQNVTGNNILWYTQANGGIGSVTTPIVTTTTAETKNIWVSQTINNCESNRALITFQVKAIPIAPVVTPKSNLCKQATASPVTATATGTLNWYSSALGGTASNTAPTPNTNIIGNQSFWVSQTEAGCEGPRSEITITVLPNPNLDAIVPSLICEGENLNVTLSFTGISPFQLVYTHQGNNENLSTQSNDYILVLNPNSDGNISFKSLTDKSCVTVYNNFVKDYLVTKLPTLNIISPDSICNQTSVSITLKSSIDGSNFDWTTHSTSLLSGASAGNLFGNNVTINQIIKNRAKSPQIIKYTVKVSYNGCVGETKERAIVVLPSYTPELPDTIPTVCLGTSMTFDAGTPPIGYKLKWYKDESEIIGQTAPTLTDIIDGEHAYKVVATSVCNSTQEATTITSIFEHQHFNDLVAYDSCANFVTVFEIETNSNILNNSKWILNRDTVDAKITYQKAKFTHQFNTLDEQILTILGFKDQCYLADTVVKFKPKDCSVEVKNTFTPNGDNQNDQWKINGIENYPQASLIIFNRWGIKIKSYDSHIPVAAWDGTNTKGELMEAGTYYYVLDFHIAGKVQKGYITLMDSK